MSINKPMLLEGPPGVGKSSLVSTLSSIYNQKLYRVNLYSQTDLIDLLGSDVPDPHQAGSFRWCDGVLLRAMKEGAWIIFDEINLANQSVLEGLNSILDYRGEIFIPELGRTVKCKEGFRFFAS